MSVCIRHFQIRHSSSVPNLVDRHVKVTLCKRSEFCKCFRIIEIHLCQSKYGECWAAMIKRILWSVRYVLYVLVAAFRCRNVCKTYSSRTFLFIAGTQNSLRHAWISILAFIQITDCIPVWTISEFCTVWVEIVAYHTFGSSDTPVHQLIVGVMHLTCTDTCDSCPDILIGVGFGRIKHLPIRLFPGLMEWVSTLFYKFFRWLCAYFQKFIPRKMIRIERVSIMIFPECSFKQGGTRFQCQCSPGAYLCGFLPLRKHLVECPVAVFENLVYHLFAAIARLAKAGNIAWANWFQINRHFAKFCQHIVIEVSPEKICHTFVMLSNFLVGATMWILKKIVYVPEFCPSPAYFTWFGGKGAGSHNLVLWQICRNKLSLFLIPAQGMGWSGRHKRIKRICILPQFGFRTEICFRRHWIFWILIHTRTSP